MVNVTAVQEAPSRGSGSARARDRTRLSAALVGIVGLACGLSPFFAGFYPLSTFGVIALGTLGVLIGLVVAGQGGLTGPAAIAVIALTALAGWAVLSISWA